MATSIDNAFIKQFEREVHEAYQRFGSKLRPTVRTIANVNGSSAVFQKVGKGAASTKSAHGMVPVMNLAHTAIEVALQDYYAGDWVDRLDEMKINIDERQVIANAGGYALGRKTDELIIAALAAVGAGQKIADVNVGMTKDKILAAYEMLGAADVPDDGQRFVVYADRVCLAWRGDGPRGMGGRGAGGELYPKSPLRKRHRRDTRQPNRAGRRSWRLRGISGRHAGLESYDDRPLHGECKYTAPEP